MEKNGERRKRFYPARPTSPPFLYVPNVARPNRHTTPLSLAMGPPIDQDDSDATPWAICSHLFELSITNVFWSSLTMTLAKVGDGQRPYQQWVNVVPLPSSPEARSFYFEIHRGGPLDQRHPRFLQNLQAFRSLQVQADSSFNVQHSNSTPKSNIIIINFSRSIVHTVQSSNFDFGLKPPSN